MTEIGIFWCNLVMIIVSLNGCYVSNFLSFLDWLLYSINSLFCLSTCAQHYIFQCCLAVLEFVLQNINYLKLVENWSLCSQKGCVGIRHINYKRFRQTENKIPIDRVPSIRCWCWIEEVYCSLLKQKIISWTVCHVYEAKRNGPSGTRVRLRGISTNLFRLQEP